MAYELYLQEAWSEIVRFYCLIVRLKTDIQTYYSDPLVGFIYYQIENPKLK